MCFSALTTRRTADEMRLPPSTHCMHASNQDFKPCAGEKGCSLPSRVPTSIILLDRQRGASCHPEMVWVLRTFQRSKLGVKGTTLSCLPHISSTGVPCSPTARTCMSHADNEMSELARLSGELPPVSGTGGGSFQTTTMCVSECQIDYLLLCEKVPLPPGPRSRRRESPAQSERMPVSDQEGSSDERSCCLVCRARLHWKIATSMVTAYLVCVSVVLVHDVQAGDLLLLCRAAMDIEVLHGQTEIRWVGR